YIDIDPGWGKAISTTLPAADGTLTFVAKLNEVTDGFHVLSIRTKDSFGSWSHTVSHPFLKTSSLKVTALEYFFNTDPGEGKGIPVTIEQPAPYLKDFVFNVDTSTLSEGEYTLHVRGKNEDGVWGLYESIPFTLIYTDIRKVEVAIPFNIYPLPADTECTIVIGGVEERNYTISLHNLSGHKLWEQFESQADSPIKVNTASLPDGIYLLTLYCIETSKSTTKRIIIKH
ncbi:T9SS type A sorting domain-containing protein, partial [Bacteroides sp. OttesenSCG-928-E20]|nr:T9SS type A sorting domain-containing protein [Bacteroides sp. OttesenSCG-928-E20]